MNTLSTIQKLSKIAKIFCKVIFICCLVGAIGCLVGIISIALIPEDFVIDGVTIHSLIEESAQVSIGTTYASMATGLILCAGEAVLSKIAEKYFTKELEDGTPFTFDGAARMMKLGLFVMCIPVATNIIVSIVYAILKSVLNNVAPMDISAFGSGSIGLGIMFILGSLLCKYGAQIKQEKEESEKQDKPERPDPDTDNTVFN